MSDRKIHEALAAHLADMAPEIATAWPNTDFTPPADGSAYQEAWFMPARNRNRNIRNGALHQGIYQVNLCYPAASGSDDVMARAVLLQAHFDPTQRIQYQGIEVRIRVEPSIAAQPLERPGYYVLPVTIEYESII